MSGGPLATGVAATSGGTNWVAVTAIATCVTAAGLGFAAVAAFWAGKQVQESERSRHAEMATHMSTRWASQELVSARDLLHELGRGNRVVIRNAYISAMTGDPTKDEDALYRATQTILRFFEDLGVMERQGGLGLGWIQLTMGTSVGVYWEGLVLTVIALRLLNRQPTAYENFEYLATAVSTAKPPKRRPRRRAGR